MSCNNIGPGVGVRDRLHERSYLKARVEALRDLAGSVDTGGDHQYDSGICGNVQSILAERGYDHKYEDTRDALHECFRSWPKYSGDTGYPVPDPDHPKDASKAFDAYYRNGNVWAGEYGELRYELLQHCITELSC